ncbi:ABC-type polysaccharide/polyol phosphate export permease [Bradyrhizobium sp. LB7.2]
MMQDSASLALLSSLAKHQRVLRAMTRLELQKKYAGSLLGYTWIVLQPLLFLGAYLLVFLVIFRVRLPGMTDLGYVAYVFSGLIPFLTLMEVATTSPVVIRQNMHLIKNVIMPVEIILLRVVAGALVVQLVGLALLLLLLGLDLEFGWKLLFLPVVVLLSALFLVGLALLLAPMGVIVP